MGADLIAYTLFGPTRLSTSKAIRAKAEKRIKEVGKLYVEWDRLDGLLDKNPDSKDPENQKIEAQLQALDRRGFEYLEDVMWAGDYLDNPGKLVDELFEVWDGNARDCVYRTDPRDPKRQAFMAGELSWGDEPSGYGYQTLKRADHAGILPLYGIE